MIGIKSLIFPNYSLRITCFTHRESQAFKSVDISLQISLKSMFLVHITEIKHVQYKANLQKTKIKLILKYPTFLFPPLLVKYLKPY